MKRRSLYFTGARTVEVIEEPIPRMAPDEVLVQTMVSAISAGTELLFYRGQVPSSMSVDEHIEGLCDASARFPLKYGYAAVGRVVERGPAVDSSWTGRVVFVFHPHESHFTSKPDALVEVPAGMSPEAAALLPTMETAVSWVMDAQPIIGERVVVFGLGVLGLVTASVLARMPLGRLVGVDAHPRRREQAVRLGVDVAIDPFAADVLETVHRAVTQDGYGVQDGADLALELSGNPEALDLAIRSVGFSGRVVVGSWYGLKSATLTALGEAFHRRHIQIQSSQVSHLHPRWAGRWTKGRRLRVALDALTRFQHDAVIGHRIPFERAAEAYEILDRCPETALQTLLTYEER